ncbi:beta-ketoacyl-[acyl-carrier-protein] synthase family protein [Zhengella sp. ZM62]|uniref:beta-ketoacyl-[acyl-carrier-protein] synthase family protein n=1 Tax=Zhengella sedimenti TaxID=3390035 RepID=UPI003975CCA4
MRRVAITGLGVLTANASSIAEFRDTLLEGRVGIAPRPIGGLVGRDMPLACIDDAVMAASGVELSPRFDRLAHLALIAAKEAMATAGLEKGSAELAEATILFGTALGGGNTLEEGYTRYFKDGRKPHPFSVPKMMPSAPAAALSMAWGIKGPSSTVSSACSSSSAAIAAGCSAILSGEADIVVSGGTESALTETILLAWEQLKVVSTDTCRPFSATRKGMVLGEGAAVVILEAEDHARARGAQILGYVAGTGATSDAADLVKPSQEGQVEAIRRALKRAGIGPRDIGYINAHGTGTRQNDIVESATIRAVFGDEPPPVSSTKSIHGHTIAAAGAIEGTATLLALLGQFAPPTMNFEEPDPECPLDVVPNASRALSMEYALSNSFAFGGHNVALIFQKAE